MSKLAIVHTESSLGWGGQELRILAEAQGLSRRGHELMLLCPPEARLYAEAPAWGLRTVALPIAKKRLPKGARIVSHDFRFPNWEPDAVVEFQGPERSHNLYLYTVK